MRKRRYLIGTGAALVMAMGSGAMAEAAGTLLGQTTTVLSQTAALDKKKKTGPVKSLNIVVDTQYAGDSTPPFAGKVINTKSDFPADFAFNTKGIPQCDPNTPGFSASTPDVAKSLCGPAQLGTGNATLIGAVAGVTAEITVFNGTPSPDGLPVVLLHSRTSSPADSTTVLVGTLRRSDQGPKFGTTLDVPTPVLAGGAFVVTHFETNLPQRQTAKKKVVKKVDKKTGKVTKKVTPPRYFISARCSTGTWDFQARSTYTDGVAPTLASYQSKCKQKKAKKSKK